MLGIVTWAGDGAVSASSATAPAMRPRRDDISAGADWPTASPPFPLRRSYTRVRPEDAKRLRAIGASTYPGLTSARTAVAKPGSRRTDELEPGRARTVRHRGCGVAEVRARREALRRAGQAAASHAHEAAARRPARVPAAAGLAHERARIEERRRQHLDLG